MSLPTMSGTARLTADPKLFVTSSGTSVCSVRLAFNSRKKDDSGEWVNGDVFYIDGTAWRQEADNIAESLTRGTEVVVTGRLRTRKYTDKEGNERSAVELLIDSIGPTLKFSTVKVNKMDRKSAGTVPDVSPWDTAPATFSDEPPF